MFKQTVVFRSDDIMKDDVPVVTQYPWGQSTSIKVYILAEPLGQEAHVGLNFCLEVHYENDVTSVTSIRTISSLREIYGYCIREQDIPQQRGSILHALTNGQIRGRYAELEVFTFLRYYLLQVAADIYRLCPVYMQRQISFWISHCEQEVDGSYREEYLSMYREIEKRMKE